MIIWKLISMPLIGAGIGYITNYLAVKMLFRPREAKYIGRFRIPFTPGVIPKGKARLARAAGNVINDELLTKKAIEDRLLSDSVISSIKKSINEMLEDLENDDKKTVRMLASGSIGEDNFNKAAERIENAIVSRAEEKISDAQIGSRVTDVLASQIQTAISGSFLGSMFGDSVINSLKPSVSKSIDKYVEDNSEDVIRRIVSEEISALASAPASKILESTGSTNENIADAAIDIYKKAVKKNSEAAVKALDAGSVAEETINNMDNKKLEEIVLKTMKTELRAIVNLGAVIGLLLGIINLIIYLV